MTRKILMPIGLSNLVGKIRRKLGSLFLVGFGAIFISACGGGSTEINGDLRQATITLEGDHLAFKTEADFQEARQKLANASPAEIQTWEAQFDGFHSMRADFAAAGKVLNDLDEKFYAMGKNAPALPVAEAELQKALGVHKGSTLNIQGADGMYSLRENISDPGLLPLVNSQGLVRVGSDWRQYNANRFKSAPASMAIKEFLAVERSLPEQNVKVLAIVNPLPSLDLNALQKIKDPDELPAEDMKEIVAAPVNAGYIPGDTIVFRVAIKYPYSYGWCEHIPFSIEPALPGVFDYENAQATEGNSVKKEKNGTYSVVYCGQPKENFLITVPIYKDAKATKTQVPISLKVGGYYSASTLITFPGDVNTDPGTTYGFETKEIQNTSDDGWHKLVVSRSLAYSTSMAKGSMTIYNFLIKNEIHGKIFQNNWKPENVHIRAEWQLTSNNGFDTGLRQLDETASSYSNTFLAPGWVGFANTQTGHYWPFYKGSFRVWSAWGHMVEIHE